MNATSGRRSDRPASRAFQRSIERASKDEKVPSSLAGALRALALIRRRSGRDPKEDELSADERELRSLVPWILRGDSIATARAHAIVRRMLTAM